MFEICSITNKSCPFCFISQGKRYCGLAHSKKHRTNIITEMKQCPEKKIKFESKNDK